MPFVEHTISRLTRQEGKAAFSMPYYKGLEHPGFRGLGGGNAARRLYRKLIYECAKGKCEICGKLIPFEKARISNLKMWGGPNREGLHHHYYCAEPPVRYGLASEVWRGCNNSTDERNLLRRLLWERGGGICNLCGKPISDFSDAHMDHIVRKSEGGPTTFDNLQLVHSRCNLKKG